MQLSSLQSKKNEQSVYPKEPYRETQQIRPYTARQSSPEDTLTTDHTQRKNLCPGGVCREHQIKLSHNYE